MRYWTFFSLKYCLFFVEMAQSSILSSDGSVLAVAVVEVFLSVVAADENLLLSVFLAIDNRLDFFFKATPSPANHREDMFASIHLTWLSDCCRTVDGRYLSLTCGRCVLRCATLMRH